MFEDIDDREIDGHGMLLVLIYDGFVVDGAEVEHGDDWG